MADAGRRLERPRESGFEKGLERKSVERKETELVRMLSREPYNVAGTRRGRVRGRSSLGDGEIGRIYN